MGEDDKLLPLLLESFEELVSMLREFLNMFDIIDPLVTFGVNNRYRDPYYWFQLGMGYAKDGLKKIK